MHAPCTSSSALMLFVSCDFFRHKADHPQPLTLRTAGFQAQHEMVPDAGKSWYVLNSGGCPLPLLLAAAAKSLQSCPTLCDPIDGSLPGSPVPGILQARTLEGVAISFSNAWKWKVKVKSVSCVQLFATPWTAAQQAPLSMGFSRQEYWSGVPSPSPSLLLRCFQMNCY